MINSHTESKSESEIISRVVLTQPGVLLLIVSSIIAIIGFYESSPTFLIPGLLLPFVFVVFVIQILRRDIVDVQIKVSFPSTSVKAKQFLAMHIKLVTNFEITGIIKIDVSDGLFPVKKTQVALIDSAVRAGASFLLYAPRRGKEVIRNLKFQYYGLLSLFYLEKTILINEEITILPQAQRISLPWKQKQRILERMAAEITTTQKGRGTEFLSLRDFLHGDEVRFIHWKASAKFGKLITKEFEEPLALRFLIVLDVSLLMAGPKLEFALSSAIELAEVIQRSDHSASVLVHGDNFNRLFKIGNSITSLQKLALDLHSINPEGTEFNYQSLQNFIVSHKLSGSVIILISDVEKDVKAISDGMSLLKPYYQALFFGGCSTTGFGTLALTKVRDYNIYDLDQLYYRREIVEPKLRRIYDQRVMDYESIINGLFSQFQLIDSYNTNILLELSNAIRVLSSKTRR